ncbi:MAG: RNA-binding domain-containing protein [Sulfolobales archaeon]
MNSNVKIRDVIISTIAHATESYEKVEKALINIIDPDLRNIYQNKLFYEDTTGYYKDPIRIYRLKISGEDSERVVKWIMSKLSKSEFETILLSLEDRYDKRSRRMFIRLSKQDAFLGEISLGFDDDIIHVSIGVSNVRSVRDLENYLRSMVSK